MNTEGKTVPIKALLNMAVTIIGNSHSQILHHEIKADKSVCTEIDVAVSKAIQRMLHETGFFDNLLNMYLDEECATSATLESIKNCNELVIVDPIDGSGAFLEGRPEYCVMIAHYKNNNGVLTPIQSAVCAPRTFETVILYQNGEVEVTQKIATSLSSFISICRKGEDVVFKGRSNRGLGDYRYEQQFNWTGKTKIDVNPSGRNVLDISMNRGRFFPFVYKPWDLCAMPIAQALGCKTYLLTEENETGGFTAKEVVDMDMSWFDYNSENNEFGKIKQPLLFCREENLAYVLQHLKQAQQF